MIDSNNVHLAYFAQISSTLAGSLSKCAVVQLLTINILNTGHLCKYKMHSPFINSSVNSVLLQTSTSRFLSSVISLNSFPYICCCTTLQTLSNGLWSGLLGPTCLEQWNLLMFFSLFQLMLHLFRFPR